MYLKSAKSLWFPLTNTKKSWSFSNFLTLFFVMPLLVPLIMVTFRIMACAKNQLLWMGLLFIALFLIYAKISCNGQRSRISSIRRFMPGSYCLQSLTNLFLVFSGLALTLLDKSNQLTLNFSIFLLVLWIETRFFYFYFQTKWAKKMLFFFILFVFPSSNLCGISQV